MTTATTKLLRRSRLPAILFRPSHLLSTLRSGIELASGSSSKESIWTLMILPYALLLVTSRLNWIGQQVPTIAITRLAPMQTCMFSAKTVFPRLSFVLSTQRPQMSLMPPSKKVFCFYYENLSNADLKGLFHASPFLSSV